MNYFIFGNKKSYEYGVWISGSFVTPSRDRDMISVPGRNGDLIFDNGRFENVRVTYPCYIKGNFRANFNSLKEYLFSNTDYVKLFDTYDTGYYRHAILENISEPKLGKNMDSGEFDVVFNCKPQRFLTSGDKTVTFTGDGSIINPTLFTSKPLIRVYGTGVLTVGGKTVEITKCSTYTDLDCDLEEAYKGSANCNGNIKVTDFPVFPSGNTGITLGEGITKIIVTPRWYVV